MSPDPFGARKQLTEETVAGKTDASWDSPFHTLGRGSTQASPGNHKHQYSELTGLPEIPGSHKHSAADIIDMPTGLSDHGALTGLGDDDHPQYLLADGTRAVGGRLMFLDGLNLHVGQVSQINVTTARAEDYQYSLEVRNQADTGLAPVLCAPSSDSSSAVVRGEVYGGATYTRDWNDAIEHNRMYSSDSNTKNNPDYTITYWSGFVATSWEELNRNIVQIAYPAFCRASSVAQTGAYTRSYQEGYGWSAWELLVGNVHSYGMKDGFTYYKHASTKRYAAGHKYHGVGGSPGANDTYRIQCYDTNGNYTWTALEVNEAGTVTHPKGHTRMVSAMTSKDPVNTNEVATVGVVATMILNALASLNLITNARAAADLLGINLVEGPPID